MVKAAWYAAVMVLMLFGAFAAHNGNIAETIWFCFCILVGLWCSERGDGK